MTARFSLDQLRIASPCPASWDEMQGDDRARFCTLCQKHVYNFAAMSADEGLALIEEKEGNLCGRLLRRRDGTVLTADCPVGWAAHVRRLRRRCVYAAIAGVLLVAGFFGLSRLRGSTQSDQASSVTIEKLEEWLDDLRVWAGLAPKRVQPIAGGICAPPFPPPNNVTSKE